MSWHLQLIHLAVAKLSETWRVFKKSSNILKLKLNVSLYSESSARHENGLSNGLRIADTDVYWLHRMDVVRFKFSSSCFLRSSRPIFQYLILMRIRSLQSDAPRSGTSDSILRKGKGAKPRGAEAYWVKVSRRDVESLGFAESLALNYSTFTEGHEWSEIFLSPH